MEKILIVDDLPANSRALALLLKSMGYKVATAESGNIALSMLNEERIGLVLLDLMMPDMNGFDVLKTMRSDPKLQSLPVVIYSATDSGRDQAIELGAQNFVVKGTANTLTALCEAIQQQMGSTFPA